MDSPAAAPPILPSRPSALSRALLVAAFIAYAVFLAFNMGAHASGSDSSGYLNSARLLAHGTTAMPQRIPAGLDPEKFDWFTFTPLGFRALPRQQMAPTYPIGLPLGLAGTARIIGWRLAPPLIMLVSALTAAALMILLGRAAGLPRSWSIFGALLFVASPLTTFMSVQLMSDIPATAAATATILCAWRSRTHRHWALLAGILLAIGVLIRPSNLILIAPVALCLGFDWRRWGLLGLGGLPGAVTQLIFSAAAYGNPLASGYGGDLATKFSFAIIPATLGHYLLWLPLLLTPVGLAALALPWFGRRSRFAWVLVTWIAVIFGFYISYWHTHETWWYLRFLLPAFPACLVGGLWVTHHLWTRFSPARLRTALIARNLALAAGLVIIAHSAVWHRRLHAAEIGNSDIVYPEAITWLRTHLPADAIIIHMQVSGALLYYSDFQFVRWDMLNPTRFAQITANALAAHRPIFAALFPHEVKDALETRLPGSWQQTAAVRDVTIWEWSPPPPP
jgi:hypothetical protein